MREIILTLFVIGILQSASAQESQLSVGYGFGSTSFIAGYFDGNILGGLYLDNSPGEFYFTYTYNSESWWGVGGTVSYLRINYKDVSTGDNRGEKQFNNIYTVAIEETMTFSKRGKFRYYAIVGLGLTLTNKKYETRNGGMDYVNNQHFNFQITPIGISYGEKFGGRLEVGFGYRGIVNAGLFYRFSHVSDDSGSR